MCSPHPKVTRTQGTKWLVWNYISLYSPINTFRKTLDNRTGWIENFPHECIPGGLWSLCASGYEAFLPPLPWGGSWFTLDSTTRALPLTHCEHSSAVQIGAILWHLLGLLVLDCVRIFKGAKVHHLPSNNNNNQIMIIAIISGSLKRWNRTPTWLENSPPKLQNRNFFCGPCLPQSVQQKKGLLSLLGLQ